MKTAQAAQDRAAGGIRCCARHCFVIVLCALLAACSTPRFDISRGQKVHLTVVKDQYAGGDIQISNAALKGDAGKGAGGGAATGAVLGLGCGFFFIICSPVFALAGTIAGGAAGAAVGDANGWPQERREKLRARLGEFQRTHDSVAMFHAAMRDRAGAYWIVGDDPSAIAVRIEVSDLIVHAARDERAAVGTEIWLVVETPEDRRNKISRLSKKVRFTGPFLHSGAWIEAPDETVAGNIQSLYVQFADKILSDLGAY
jgi:hypothetical protein